MRVAEARVRVADARRPLRRRASARQASTWQRIAPRVLLPAALLATFAAQARTLSFYFFQDDYVPFGEIVTNGTGEYLHRLFVAQDLTPNWRVIPGLMYLASYKLFGMSPLPMHIALLALHLGTVALLYRAIERATGSIWVALAGGLVFGLQPSYAGTLGQVASVPHVASAFFLVAALNAIFESARSRTEAGTPWFVAAVVLYVLALASNESMAVMFPAFGLAFLGFDPDEEGRMARSAWRALPFAAIGVFAALAVRTCDCTEASSVYSLENAHRAFLIYAGRLLYPIGLEPPTYIDTPHLIAAAVLLVVSGAMLVFGNAIGRVGAVWMLLAIVPHIFVSTHTASRFTYLATPGFAMLAAGCAIVVRDWLDEMHPLLPGAVAAIVLVLLSPWYAWQTHLQNEPWRRTTSDWQLLHDEAQRVYPTVPAGGRVEVIGGPLVHPLDNFFVMPALGYTIWGPGVTFQTFGADDPYAATLRTSADHRYAAEFADARLQPLRPAP